jgi:hypothetical protein
MYFLIVPKEYRNTLRDNVTVLRCWAPFVIWVQALVVCTFLNWVCVNSANIFGDSPVIVNSVLIAVQLSFIVVEKCLCAIPVRWVMGAKNDDLALMWNLGYMATCTTFQEWLFVGTDLGPTDIAGTLLMWLINIPLCLLQCRRAVDFDSHIQVLLINACDVISGLAFLQIYLYNAYGPNQSHFYMICDLTETEKFATTITILVTVAIAVCKFWVIIKMIQANNTETELLHMKFFSLKALRQWYWLVVWLLVCVCCACGACMVMKHDGMDMSFRFLEWQGQNAGWPFNQEG